MEFTMMHRTWSPLPSGTVGARGYAFELQEPLDFANSAPEIY